MSTRSLSALEIVSKAASLTSGRELVSLHAGDQQRGDCHVRKVDAGGDGRNADRHPHDRLHPWLALQRPAELRRYGVQFTAGGLPRGAAAGGRERGDGPARVPHHARTRHVDAPAEPAGKLVEDLPMTSRARSAMLNGTLALAQGAGSPVVARAITGDFGSVLRGGLAR